MDKESLGIAQSKETDNDLYFLALGREQRYQSAFSYSAAAYTYVTFFFYLCHSLMIV